MSLLPFSRVPFWVPILTHTHVLTESWQLQGVRPEDVEEELFDVYGLESEVTSLRCIAAVWAAAQPLVPLEESESWAPLLGLNVWGCVSRTSRITFSSLEQPPLIYMWVWLKIKEPGLRVVVLGSIYHVILGSIFSSHSHVSPCVGFPPCQTEVVEDRGAGLGDLRLEPEMAQIVVESFREGGGEFFFVSGQLAPF